MTKDCMFLSNRELKTQQLFLTLVDLLADRPLASIRVTVLCRQAGISRTFFYRHFKSPEDIIASEFSRRRDQYLHILVREQIHDPFSQTVRFFELFNSFREPAKQLIDANLRYILYFHFRDWLKNLVEAQLLQTTLQDPQYWTVYLAGGLSEMILLWLQNEPPQSPEQMAQMVFNFINIPDQPN